MPQPQHTSRCDVQLPLSAAFENQTMISAQNAHIFDPDYPIGSKPLNPTGSQEIPKLA
jgi:hypothetical protein